VVRLGRQIGSPDGSFRADVQNRPTRYHARSRGKVGSAAEKMVTVIIVNWNSGNLLRVCIESLLVTAPAVDIVVVDNASTDASLEAAGGFLSQVDLVQNSVNRGFAAAVNQGFSQTSTAYVLVLNPDIRVMPGAVENLARFLDEHPKAGAVGGYVNDKYLPRNLPVATTLIG